MKLLNKKSKSELESQKSITTSNSSNSLNASFESAKSENPKFDMKGFSKLTLNQQVLKRYEIMNLKPPASALGAQVSKVKKAEPGAGDAAKKQEPHVPQLIIDPNSTPRIPLVMRQRYLKIIFENCKSSFASLQKACEKASEQEKSIYDRSKSKPTYLNLCANMVRSLRAQNPAAPTSASVGSMSINNKLVNGIPKNIQKPSNTYSHEAMMNGPKASKVSYSINRVKQIEIKDLNGESPQFIINLFSKEFFKCL